MPDFLLEIGTEEIPARMIQDASAELARRVRDLVSRESLIEPILSDDPTRRGDFDFYQTFSTPRRLSIIINNVAFFQPDVTEQIIGPSTKVAYKDGKPTPAAEAFAKKAGLDVSKLETITNPKGEYLSATVTKKGRKAAEILAEALPKEIAGIYWPKNMYWRAGKPERFVRPVRWIVAMLDSDVIPVEFAGVAATNETRGHRILCEGQHRIPHAKEYETVLRKANVIVDRLARFQRIDSGRLKALEALAGFQWRKDVALIETVENLTEWPSVILGSFDQQYLSLPEEVLVTVMRDHQKYFAVEDAAGKLAPHFLTVLNTDGDPDGLIRHGNERVLRARFNDARFFWDTDQKTTLEDRVKMLSAVTFQKDLGSYYDKTGRVQKLATDIAMSLHKTGLNVRADMVADAAKLSKTDLTTELVKEFTELQGIIGGLYAKAQGSPESVATAIYDQYKPESTEDSAPRTLEGAVLSIADKADSIAGMFALGLVPSGSKDPFALRRQANGIVKTIVEHKLPLNLAQIMADARSGYQGSEAEKKFTLSGEAYVQAVRGFFRERLEFYLRDVLELNYDVVNATLAVGADDAVDALARASAVAAVRLTDNFESISIAFKRMKNILRQAAETKTKIAKTFDPAALKDHEERVLAAVVPLVASKVHELSGARQYDLALQEISRVRPQVDAFFDKVMVMVDDETLRAERLGLLQTLVREFSSIADFSEIVQWRPWEQTIWVKRKGRKNLVYVDGRTFERTPAPGILEIYRGPGILARFDDVEDWGMWGDGSEVRSKYKVEY